MRRTFAALCALLLFHASPRAQTSPVVIAGSQVQKITSSIVPQQEYELQVMLPAGYGKSTKRYPVVYLLDSQWDFPLVTALYGQQYFDGFVPETVVVGITWTGKYANADSLRARDYTPTHNAQLPQSGGASAFLSVLKKEVLPFVERSYRTDSSNRTLMGCSFGGLFTVYALFTEPGLFKNYVAATPAVGWDNESIYAAERRYFEHGNKPSARLYLCVGGVEKSVPAYEKFVAQLTGRGYKNLQLKSTVLENIGHSGTKGEGYERGLQFAFERPSVCLSAEKLQLLSGTYQGKDGRAVVVKAENGQVVVDAGNNNRLTLYAASENEFYSKTEFLNVYVTRKDGNAVAGFELERYGETLTFTKVK